MSAKPSPRADTSAINQAVQRKVQEAELYLKQGLLSDAQRIYTELVTYFRSYLQVYPDCSPRMNAAIRQRIEAFEQKLTAIEQRAEQLGRRLPLAVDAPSKPGPGQLLQHGIALKALGLYQDAVQAFKQIPATEDAGLAKQLYKMGADLLAEGHSATGIELLRLAARHLPDSSMAKAPVLMKIGGACEKAGEQAAALTAYRQVLTVDPYFEPARQKTHQLSKALKPPLFSFETVCLHPWIFLTLSILMALGFAVFNPAVQTVNNVDYFRLENDPDNEFYETFKEVFGNDEFFIIAFEADPLFSEKNLRLLDRITTELEALEAVERVTSLTNVDDIIGGTDYFEVRRFLEAVPDDPETLASLRAQAVNNYLYVKNLLPKDARAAAIIVEAHDRPDDEDYRQRLLRATDEVLKPYRDDVPAFYLAGWTTTNYSLSQYLKADMMIFVPATYLLITLVTWLFFRNWRLTLLAVVNISVCLLATRGLMGLTGITLNNVTSIVIPLVMALSLCDTVHIFSHMDKRILKRFPDKRLALAHVLKRVAFPCLLTTLTTGVGFLSLALSDIVPIKEFAYIASAGMVFEFLFSFFLLPPLLLLYNPQTVFHETQSRQRVGRLISRLSHFVATYHRPIVWVSGAMIVMALVFASSLRVETNLVEFFKKSSPVRTAMDYVEKRLSGVGTLDVSFQADTLDAFKVPENLRLIERVQQYIDSVENVDKTLSFVDFLKDMHASFHGEDVSHYKIPPSVEMVAQYMLIYDADDIADYINLDYDHARIAVRISEHSSSGQKRIVEQIKSYLAALDHPSIDMRVTGRAVIDTNVIDAMVMGQITSLSAAALVIGLMMFLVFRSVTIAAWSLIPNFFPIVLNFGIMGAFGIPLNTGTALIAAVALGIAVDDTIHFLSEYQRQRRQNRPVGEALHAASTIKGQALLTSSVILCIGFGVMVLSRFVPIMHFGLLSAIIMLTALVGDLVVLPAMMLLKSKRANGVG